jgi:rubrerythrin
MRTEYDIDRSISAAPLDEVLEGLNDLLRFDHDAIGAYEIAIERLENRAYSSRIASFLGDHQDHIRRLNDLIRELGGSPTNEPHATAPLKQALQALGDAGGDKGLLITWRANELQMMTKYERYVRDAARWPAHVRQVVEENARDEERHYAWVIATLGGNASSEAVPGTRRREPLAAQLAHVREFAAEQIRSHPSRSLIYIFAVGIFAGRHLR